MALSFRLTAGTGPAGYLLGFTVKLPKYVSWNRAALKNDIVIPGDKYTYAIKAGRLVISFTGGKKLVNFRIKAGGVKVGKGLEALAKKRKIASEGIALTVDRHHGQAQRGVVHRQEAALNARSRRAIQYGPAHYLTATRGRDFGSVPCVASCGPASRPAPPRRRPLPGAAGRSSRRSAWRPASSYL